MVSSTKNWISPHQKWVILPVNLGWVGEDWFVVCRLRTERRKISSLRLVHERLVIWIHLFFPVKMKCSMISMKDGPWRNSKWSASTIPGIAVKKKGYWPSCVFKMRRWSRSACQVAKWHNWKIKYKQIIFPAGARHHLLCHWCPSSRFHAIVSGPDRDQTASWGETREYTGRLMEWVASRDPSMAAPFHLLLQPADLIPETGPGARTWPCYRFWSSSIWSDFSTFCATPQPARHRKYIIYIYTYIYLVIFYFVI